MRDRSDEGRARAEAKFKKKEHITRESEKVWAEHVAKDRAADANRAKLKAQRLARDAAASDTADKAKPTRVASPSSTATAMESLVRESKEREVLPTHRQVPAKSEPKKRLR